MLLITDLDGTLLGDARALDQFGRWLGERRNLVTLVYATGRTVAAVAHAAARRSLPAPDHVIGSVGCEIAEFRNLSHDETWETPNRKGWNVATVRRVAECFGGLAIQPDEFQSDLKVSYFWDEATNRRLEDLDMALTSSGMAAELTYSGSRFLDIMPRGVNKGSAARYLIGKLGVESRHVIACGDSGNDASLFSHGFRGVVVANAEADLIRRVGPEIYRSSQAHAAGVLDGIRYWTEVNDGSETLGAS